MVGCKGAHPGVVRVRRTSTAERPANPIDRYSLVLQLIQVLPIVSGAVLTLVTVTWLARVLAAAGLLAGTVWVVWRERVPALSGSARDDEPEAEDEGEYEAGVSIRISSPGSSAYRHRHCHRQRRLREWRNCPALPRADLVSGDRRPSSAPSRALLHHEIRSQPEMALRIVDDQSPDVH
jgi:hypothetical protein